MDLNTILALAGIGGTAAGTILGSKAQNKGNDINAQNADRLFGMAQQEQQRRDALTNFLMPQIAKSMRISGAIPQFGSGAMGSSQQMQPQTGGLAQPGTPRAGTIGDIVTGATLAGPVGAVVGGASNLFGRGRRAADPWTKTTQNDFGQQVAGIIDPFNAAKAAGTLTPEQQQKAQDDFNRLLAQYTASANQYAGQGGQQNKVIGQMWKQFGGPGYIPDWKKTLGIQ